MAVTVLWIIECKFYKRGRHWAPSIRQPFTNREAAEETAVRLASENPGWQYRVVEFIRTGATGQEAA